VNWSTTNCRRLRENFRRVTEPSSFVFGLAFFPPFFCRKITPNAALLDAKIGSAPVAIANNVEHNVAQLLEAAWKSFAECKRKTIALIASFIGLTFHSVIFHIAGEQVRYV
jgi:hypothetical protein